MIEYIDKFNPPSTVSEIMIEEGESLITVKIFENPKRKKGTSEKNW